MNDGDGNNIDQIKNLLIQLTASLKKELDKPDRIIIWQSILGNIEGIIDGYKELKRNEDELAGYWLVSVAIGLKMYFSYYDMAWISNESGISALVTKIVTTSAISLNSILNKIGIQTQLCGQHEDGACLIEKMTRRCRLQSKKGDCKIPDDDYVNFIMPPKKKIFHKGDKLFRVIGPNNIINGNWWLQSCLPQNKTQWRSQYAVLSDWNQDDYYVEYAVNDKIEAWIGYAASQHVFGR